MLKPGDIIASSRSTYTVTVIPQSNGGMSQVAYVVSSRDGKRYFLKELMEKHHGSKNDILFESTKRKLYESLNRHSLPGASCTYIEDFFRVETCYYVVTNLLVGFELNPQIISQQLSEQQCLEIATALAYALIPFEKENIVHADLKPANIILKPKDERLLVKLIDFESAFFTSSPPEAGSIVGTAEYYSPELFIYNCKNKPIQFTTKSDIFSLGLIFFELFTGKRYGYSYRGQEQFRKMSPCELALEGYLPESNNIKSSKLRRLIESMLDPNPSIRPNILTVFNTLKSTKLNQNIPMSIPYPEILIERYANNAIVSFFNYRPKRAIHYTLDHGMKAEYKQPFEINDDGIEMTYWIEGKAGSETTILNLAPKIAGRVRKPAIDENHKSDGYSYVTIKCETSGATIIYTTDGSEPKRGNGSIYSRVLRVKSGHRRTIKARAMKIGKKPSDVSQLTID